MFLIFKYNVIMRAILISLVLLFMSVMGNAQSLTLKIGGIENAEGFLYVGIYSSEESFMKKPAYGFRVEVKDTLVTVALQRLTLQVLMPFLFFRMRMAMVCWIPALLAVRLRSSVLVIMPKGSWGRPLTRNACLNLSKMLRY